MSPFRAMSRDFRSNGMFKDNRKSVRKRVSADAWIRNGFAVRACRIVDMSDTGVQFRLNTDQTQSGVFTFMTTQTSRSGRQARVKWRRGTQIGAEFL